MTAPQSPIPNPQSLDAERRLPWPLWACFVACSWTWLIGMFLPVILMHDFGPWAWVIFAVPNVIGAMSVGIVFRNPEKSRRFVANHRPAMLAFSWVTLAFHFWVMGWLNAALIGVLGLVLIVVILPLLLRPHWLVACAVLPLAVSLVYAFELAGYSLFESLFPPEPLGPGMVNLREWNDADPYRFASTPVNTITYLWLACGTTLGFLTCPYMDLSLHRAAQHTGGGKSIAAFAIGFGVLFLILIAMTARYAYHWDLFLINEIPSGLINYFPLMLIVHMSLQAAYTMACHTREVGRQRTSVWIIAIIAAVLLLGIGMLPPMYRDVALLGLDLHWGDLIYRSWMGFYGIVFPAYVILCVIPNRATKDAPATKPTRWQLYVTAGVSGITLPLFALGFLAGHMVWVGIAVVIVLLAVVLVKRPKPLTTS